MDRLIEYLAKEWEVVSKALFTFITLIVLTIVAVFIVIRWVYERIISNKDSEITLLKAQRDDYRDKLDGATPDQAKARMAALEARIQRIEPRRLTPDQKKAIAAMAKPPTGTTYVVDIFHDGACTDCNLYASDISAAIKQVPNWEVHEPMVIGPAQKSPKGVLLSVPNTVNPPPEGTILMQALTAAHIEFDLLPLPKPETTPTGAKVSVLITARVVQ